MAEAVVDGRSARTVRGLALLVVEIGGHGDHRFGDGFAQERLGILLQTAQDERGQFLRAYERAPSLVERLVPM